jgi:hypothetical protein
MIHSHIEICRERPRRPPFRVLRRDRHAQIETGMTGGNAGEPRDDGAQVTMDGWFGIRFHGQTVDGSKILHQLI